MRNAVLYESRAGFKIARRNINNLRYADVCLVAQLCPTFCDPTDCSSPSSSDHAGFPGKNAGVGCHVLFQGIFPTQGLNPGLPHFWDFFFNDPGSPRYADTSTVMAEREEELKDLMVNLWDKAPLIMQCDSFNALLHLVLVFC